MDNLTKNGNTRISNDILWTMITYLPGKDIPNKSLSYYTDEFGEISKNRITRICEEKFGAKKIHDGNQRLLEFNRKDLERFKDNYSPIDKIEIIGQYNTNSSNTFNSFWKGVERNERINNKTNSNNLTKNIDNTCQDNGKSSTNSEINTHPISSKDQSNEFFSPQMLEPLKVLGSGKRSTQDETNSSVF